MALLGIPCMVKDHARLCPAGPRSPQDDRPGGAGGFWGRQTGDLRPGRPPDPNNTTAALGG